MEEKKIRRAVAVCLCLFLAGLVLSSLLARQGEQDWTHMDRAPVVLSEVLSSNRTYPNGQGELLDFIEVHNRSTSPVDLSGYMLGDDRDTVGYTFPEGTVLDPGGYALCWCSRGREGYADFGIAREGGDVICLYNSANVLVDEVEVPWMEANRSLARTGEAQWEPAAFATPGYENSQAGYEAWLEAMGGYDFTVAITEVMTDNTVYALGPEDEVRDWVELANLGTEEAVLTGAYLSDDPAQPLKWQLPALVLQAGERRVIRCVGSSAGAMDAPFALGKTGCTLVLTGHLGNELCRVEVPTLGTDQAWARTGDGWLATDRATPGFENGDAGYNAWMASLGMDRLEVAITEVMTGRHSTVRNSAGHLCDWVELTNLGSEAADLTGAFLSDDGADRRTWAIPALVLQAGERAVIPCVGTDPAEQEAPFGLSSDGTTVLLCGRKGNVISRVEVLALGAGESWAMDASGEYGVSIRPTPGQENNQAGYLAHWQSLAPQGSLMIREVASANQGLMIQSNGAYYDWVELENCGSGRISLGDYCLSKTGTGEDLCPLPQKTLKPGERVVVMLSGLDALAGNYLHTALTLNAKEDWLYLCQPDGRVLDLVHVVDVPLGGSMGRIPGEYGWYYFDTPTPGKANGNGAAQIAPMPRLADQGGVRTEDAVTVTLEGTGTIYYTTDGSVPTADSQVYEAPIPLDRTTVLRAVNGEPGKLLSDVLTVTFVLGEGHTLPVVSLTAEPKDLFGSGGILTTNDPDREVPCHVEYYGESTFSVDCGLELLGSTPSDREKKQWKLNFRSRYGTPVLGTDLFGPEGVQVFDALTLSAGDDRQTMMRGVLFGVLARKMESAAPVARQRFCVVYLNGTYWGIYSIGEDLTELWFAQYAGVTEQSVTVLDQVPSGEPELESLVDWMILQGFGCGENLSRELCIFTSDALAGWTSAATGLDGALQERTGFASVLELPLIREKMKEEQFRQSLFLRMRELSQGPLSQAQVLEVIQSLEQALAPEVDREKERWGGDRERWEADVERLKSLFLRDDHWGMLVESLAEGGMTPEERTQYFGG